MLVELLAIWGCEYDLVIRPFFFQMVDATFYRLYLHDHTSKASKRVIVHPTILVIRIVSQIVYTNFSQSFVLGTLHDRAIEKALDHFR